jgi:hypothetical protein
MKMSITKTRDVAFHGKSSITAKLVLNDKPTERVSMIITWNIK